MLTLYRSSNLNSLAGRLLDEVGERRKPNPLQPDCIILQNNQMKRWLQKFIAREQGIAANLETEFPGEFIWEIYHQMDENLPETLPCEREPMRFSIFEVLQSGKHNHELQPLYDYIETEVEGGTSERAWNLSVHIADLFDRYQIYRPEMILKWQEGELQTNTRDEKWQAVLWKTLQQRWGDQLGDLKYRNRAELHKGFLRAIKEKKLTRKQLNEPINIFAVADLAPAFLQTFVVLSEIVEVNFYWLDVIHTENNDRTLTESWGKTGREFIELFESYVDATETEFKVIPGKLQNLTDTIASSDGINRSNIQVHSCHSPTREVEVLYDQLLAMFNGDRKVNPADVLITTSDIETYAPIIDSVFSSPDKGQPQIPYHISDRHLSQDSTAQSFIKLLDLMESRFKVTDVLDFLSAVSVRESFDISEDELSCLEQWIDGNNIRWGIDAFLKENLELPASDHFTWKSGLQKMLLGTVMEPSGNNLFEGNFPYSEISTSADAVLVGKLSTFLNSLFELYRKTKTSKTLAKWVDVISNTFHTFLTNEVQFKNEVSELFLAVDKLKEQGEAARFNNKVSFKIIQLWVKDELKKKGTGSGFSGRGVTFSSMITPRNIPFKMLGMIGMNDDAFPRKDMPIGFDLMKNKPQTGDPNRLEEDRYFFLEALMSAEQYIYFSYVGQNNREEADFPPSVLITELLNQYGMNPEGVIQKHPLQNFSIDYFKNNELFTYAESRRKIAGQLLSSQAEKRSWLGASLPEPEASKTISVDDLISYYQHPAKFVLKERLDIFIKNEKLLDENRELFALKGLNKYGVKQTLIETYLEKQSFDGLHAVLRAQDYLPEGWPGDQAFEQKASEAKAFGEQVLEIRENRTVEEAEIDLEIAGYKLTGNISGYYSPIFLDYRFGRRRAKDIIAWWIKHVVLNAADETANSVNSILLTWEQEKLQKDYLGVLENSKTILKDLLVGYWEGLQKIGYYFPRASYAFAEQMDKNSSEDKAIDKALKEWEPNEYSLVQAESEDVYVKLISGDENPLEHPAFKKAAYRFWEPFFNVFNQYEK